MTAAQYKQFCEGGWIGFGLILLWALLKAVT